MLKIPEAHPVLQYTDATEKCLRMLLTDTNLLHTNEFQNIRTYLNLLNVKIKMMEESLSGSSLFNPLAAMNGLAGVNSLGTGLQVNSLTQQQNDTNALKLGLQMQALKDAFQNQDVQMGAQSQQQLDLQTQAQALEMALQKQQAEFGLQNQALQMDLQKRGFNLPEQTKMSLQQQTQPISLNLQSQPKRLDLQTLKPDLTSLEKASSSGTAQLKPTHRPVDRRRNLQNQHTEVGRKLKRTASPQSQGKAPRTCKVCKLECPNAFHCQGRWNRTSHNCDCTLVKINAKKNPLDKKKRKPRSCTRCTEYKCPKKLTCKGKGGVQFHSCDCDKTDKNKRLKT